MMKLNKAARRFTFAVVAAAMIPLAATAQEPAANANAPAEPARVLTVDRNDVFRGSAAGQDIMKQAEEIGKTFREEAEAKGKALAEKGRELEGKRDYLAPAKLQEEVQNLRREAAMAEREVQINARRVQLALQRAQVEMNQALGPIFAEIMRARGSNMLVDRAAVIAAPVYIDISEQVIEKMDATGKRFQLVLPEVTDEPAAGQP